MLMAPPAGAPEGAGAQSMGKGGGPGGSASSSLYLFVNGKECKLVAGKDFGPETTLLNWLRARGLTGTKLGCGEGGCGACTISVSNYDKVHELQPTRCGGARHRRGPMHRLRRALMFCPLRERCRPRSVRACEACVIDTRVAAAGPGQGRAQGGKRLHHAPVRHGRAPRCDGGGYRQRQEGPPPCSARAC